VIAVPARAAVGRPGVREVLLFAAALLAYQTSRAVVIGDASAASSHAWDVLRLERELGLDVEDAIQGWALATPGVPELLNAFYLAGHLPVTAAFFVWLFMRRRHAYRLLRDGFLAANAIALCVFVAFPTAPPRLTEGVGLADTLRAESGVDLHGGPLAGWFNPYAAVPSMHFGYALLVGVGVAALSRSRMARLAGPAYPLLVLVAITATGNHFVLDAAAGALVMGLGLATVAAVRLTMARRAGPARAGRVGDAARHGRAVVTGGQEHRPPCHGKA
jgi:PAP2 superfamily